MATSTPDFSLAVEGIKGICLAGEAYAEQNIADQKIPVFSCEGPCIRGEIARLAASIVARKLPLLGRCCHAEAFLVPHSSMARWARGAERAVMNNGFFLKRHGRILKNLLDEGRMIHIDALAFYRKYTNVFLYTDIPQAERETVAGKVADKIVDLLENETGIHRAGTDAGASGEARVI